MRAEIEGDAIRVYGVKPSAIGAEVAGAAAAARTDAIAYTESRVQEITGGNPTPEEIGAIPQSVRGQPWGVADLGADGKLWIHHRPPLPTPQDIGAVPQSVRGQPWGVADLGPDGKLWSGQRPPLPTPQDIGAVPQSVRGQPWGVADLGSDGKLWSGHRPPLPKPADIGAIAQSERGQIWGVAELGSDGKVRAEQLPNFQQMLEPLYPTSAIVLWGFGRIVAGNAFAPGSISTNSQLNRYATQSPATMGDEVEVTFLLKNGYYRLELWGMRNSQQGIFQAYLNDQQLGGDIDRYASAAGPIAHSFNVSIHETRIQRFRTKVIGRNASSVGFQLWISALLVYPIL